MKTKTATNIRWDKLPWQATTLLMGCVAWSAPWSTAAEGSVAPSYAKVRSITYAGSGCPAGTVAENLSGDLKAFTLLFDDYIAEAGQGISFREGRKNCQINVDLEFPSGWSYSVIDVDYRGYVSLDRRVKATQKSSYYFQGNRRTTHLQTNMYGPLDKDYQVSDKVGLDAQIWSPCGAVRSLNINTQVRVNNRRNRRGEGLITLDSLDGALTHVYGIQWRRCR